MKTSIKSGSFTYAAAKNILGECSLSRRKVITGYVMDPGLDPYHRGTPYKRDLEEEILVYVSLADKTCWVKAEV